MQDKDHGLPSNRIGQLATWSSCGLYIMYWVYCWL